MSLNYSISQAKRRRRDLQWQIAGETIGEWYHHLLPVAWMLFGVILGIIIKGR